MKKILLLAFPIVALILEILPYGAVLNFANPEGAVWHRTYSYFSLTPFGYGNVGPFITAVLTAVLVVLTVICLFKTQYGLKTAIMLVSGFATVTSLMPLIFGSDYVTAISVAITVFLVCNFLACFIKGK